LWLLAFRERNDIRFRVISPTHPAPAGDGGRNRTKHLIHRVKERLPSDVVDQFGGVLDGAGNMASGAVDKAKDAGGSVSSLASSGAGASGSAWDKAKGAVSDLMPGDE
jgi:hypothetical protein